MRWQELPVGIQSLDDLVRLLNESIRDTEAIEWDAGGSNIRNVGAPRSPSDALSLAEADRRYLKVGWRPPASQTASNAAPAVVPPDNGGGVVSGAFIRLDIDLTGSTPTINEPVVDGQMLVVRIKQTAGGGHSIPWGANFAGNIPAPAGDLNAETVYSFFAFDRSGSLKWVLAAQPAVL